MDNASVVVLYITTASADDAARIGRALVEERLCACANVIAPVRSFYRWEGRIQDDREAVLIAKTDAGKVEAATVRIKSLHSYELPCIVALPVSGGNADFLEWVARETGSASE
ncbi:MAG: divalent-cation tolerance protein CutA [Alphaproteobacteria bacterium]